MSIRISEEHRTGARERFMRRPFNAVDHGSARATMHFTAGQMVTVGMTPQEMIAEWRKGCSCAKPEAPEVCTACTRALIDALVKVL